MEIRWNFGGRDKHSPQVLDVIQGLLQHILGKLQTLRGWSLCQPPKELPGADVLDIARHNPGRYYLGNGDFAGDQIWQQMVQYKSTSWGPHICRHISYSPRTILGSILVARQLVFLLRGFSFQLAWIWVCWRVDSMFAWYHEGVPYPLAHKYSWLEISHVQ